MFRHEMGLDETKICNTTFGKEAAKYYFDNRQASNKNCKRQIEFFFTQVRKQQRVWQPLQRDDSHHNQQVQSQA